MIHSLARQLDNFWRSKQILPFSKLVGIAFAVLIFVCTHLKDDLPAFHEMISDR